MIKRSLAITAIAAICVSMPACASEMVYHPVNPTFGGNPLNGTFLLSTAQAQGEGVKSGNQGPDLSGLNNALSNLGSAVVIAPPGTGNGTPNNNGGGNTVP
jgi:curli production assembly/transport component CsgF